MVVWILVGTYTISRILKAIFGWYAEEISSRTNSKVDDTLMPLMRKIINAFILFGALMMILGLYGIEITPLLAGMGIGGLAIAMALQPSLSNLFSGIFTISDKVLGVGDYIELDNGISGTVKEVGWRSCKIQTWDNNIVVIPNSKLSDSTVLNYNAPHEEISVLVPVGVGYNSDLDRVEKITVDVAKAVMKKTPGAKKDYDPVIRYYEFGDSNINFNVIMRVKKRSDKFLLTHEFIKALKKRYDKEGIDISYPVRKVIMNDKKNNFTKIKKKKSNNRT